MGHSRGIDRELESSDVGDLTVPATDAYSLRLVVNRKLYDRGTLLTASPSSAGLAEESMAMLNPADATPLGIGGSDTGDSTRVKLTSAQGSMTIHATQDATVPKGTVLVHHNRAGSDPGELIGAGATVCEVRVEVS